jgi:hypothetical protein
MKSILSSRKLTVLTVKRANTRNGWVKLRKNIPITIQKSKESSPWLLKLLGRYNIQESKLVERTRDNLSKAIDKALSGEEGQQFSIYISKGLHYSLNSNNNSYFSYQCPIRRPQEHKEALMLTHNDGPSNQEMSLKIVEKQLTF